MKNLVGIPSLVGLFIFSATIAFAQLPNEAEIGTGKWVGDVYTLRHDVEDFFTGPKTFTLEKGHVQNWSLYFDVSDSEHWDMHVPHAKMSRAGGRDTEAMVINFDVDNDGNLNATQPSNFRPSWVARVAWVTADTAVIQMWPSKSHRDGARTNQAAFAVGVLKKQP